MLYGVLQEMGYPVTPRLIDLTGQRFGKLTVLNLVPNPETRKLWLCRCDCGETTVSLGSNLKTGNSTSCGCNRRQHGMSKTKVHHNWRQMIFRCENANDSQYADYGGRGITVCTEWHAFVKFFEDMGHPPRNGTLERRDNNKGYAKENCYWATRKQQARNKRTNRLLAAFGRTQTVTDWALEKGMPPRTLFNRLFRAKMEPEEALTAPLYAQQRKSKESKMDVKKVEAALYQIMGACELQGESGTERLFYLLRSALKKNNIVRTLKRSHSEGLCYNVVPLIAEEIASDLPKHEEKRLLEGSHLSG